MSASRESVLFRGKFSRCKDASNGIQAAARRGWISTAYECQRRNKPGSPGSLSASKAARKCGDPVKIKTYTRIREYPGAIRSEGCRACPRLFFPPPLFAFFPYVPVGAPRSSRLVMSRGLHFKEATRELAANDAYILK